MSFPGHHHLRYTFFAYSLCWCFGTKCSCFKRFKSLQTVCEMQRLHWTAAFASWGWPALSIPFQPPCCCLHCSHAAVTLRWAITVSLWERMICSASAWKKKNYTRRVTFSIFFCCSEGKSNWRRNKNNTSVPALPKTPHKSLNHVFSLSCFSSDRKGKDVLKTRFWKTQKGGWGRKESIIVHNTRACCSPSLPK